MRYFPHFSERYSKLIEEHYPEAYDFLNNFDTKSYSYNLSADSLISAFTWLDTPQGYLHWNDIHYKIEDMLKLEYATSVKPSPCQIDLGDPINHPEHYTSHPSGIECIQVTEHMSFCVGNVFKYLWRAGLKGENELEDAKKAEWYLKRHIEMLEKAKG